MYFEQSEKAMQVQIYMLTTGTVINFVLRHPIMICMFLVN